MKIVLAVGARKTGGSSRSDRDHAVDEGITRAMTYVSWAFPARDLPKPVVQRFDGVALMSWSDGPSTWSLEGYSAEQRRAVDGVGYVDRSYGGAEAARARDLLTYSTELGGCFNLFRASDHRIEAVTDATKSNSVYFSMSDRLWIISSRALLAHMVATGSDRPTFDLSSLSAFPTKGYIIGDGTPYEGVSTLGVAEHIVLTPEGVSRSSAVPVAASGMVRASTDDWNDIVSTAAESLVQAFDPLAGGEVHLALTGGRDSRVVAAALSHHGGISVTSHTMGVATDPDVVLAAEIAAKMGWSHAVTQPSRMSAIDSTLLAEDPMDRITRVLDVHDAMNSAWDDIEDYGPVAPRPIMSGVGGEILRGGLVLTSHTELTPELAQRELRAALGNSKFVAEPYISSYGAYYLDMVKDSPFRAIDDFYYHERNGRWVASRRMGARFRRRVIDPLLDNRFIRATRQIDPRTRWEERLAFEMVSRLQPSLRDLRMEGNRWRFERSEPYPSYGDGWESRAALSREAGIASFNWKNLTDASMRKRVDELIMDGIQSGPASDLLNRKDVEQFLLVNKFPGVRWHLATLTAMLSEPWWQTARSERQESIVVRTDTDAKTNAEGSLSTPVAAISPAVSVIVPMHNAERHIQETLESLAAQSMLNFEVIVVDDGSTDRSAVIVDAFVARDDRFQRVEGPAVGSAGAARNVGLGFARGEYLAFLDADDLFAPSALDKLYAKAKADDADIVFTGFRSLDDVTREQKAQPWAFRKKHLPANTPFAPGDLADHIFHITNPANWNKLFRRDFVERAGIVFQPLRRANDAFFTYSSLAMADRISYVDEALVLYRVGNTASLQGSIHETPLEFVEALNGLYESLTAAGRYERHERAFTNLVAAMSIGALAQAKTSSAFIATYAGVREGVFVRFGLMDAQADVFLTPYLERRTSEIVEKTVA